MRLLKPRDQFFDGFDCIEALRIRIGNGLAVGHLVVGIEFSTQRPGRAWTLSRQKNTRHKKKKPRMEGGYGASRLQLL